MSVCSYLLVCDSLFTWVPLVGDSVCVGLYSCVSVVQMSHAMQVKPADSEGKAGMSSWQ